MLFDVIAECQSAPGAGRSLGWTIIIDGQANRDPVTSYGLPSITNVTYTDNITPVTGMHAVRTDGNLTLRLTGNAVTATLLYVLIELHYVVCNFFTFLYQRPYRQVSSHVRGYTI